MKAFHGDPKIKEEYLTRVRAHAAADEIVKGRFWENGKGCAVGCTIHGSKHSDYEILLGIPVELAYLEDSLFESISTIKAKKWPELFLQSIAVGADLSLVYSKFAVSVLGDKKRGCLLFANIERTRSAIHTVIALHQKKMAGEIISPETWDAAADAAKSSYTLSSSDSNVIDAHASYSAFYAASCADAPALRSVIVPASCAAASFGINTTKSYEDIIRAYLSERKKHFKWMADLLIQELIAAPVAPV